MNVRKASFDNVPQEVLMKILFPFCDLRSLKELSKVNPEWNLAVRRFMKEFNKVVILTVNSHSRDLLHFVAQQTTKLVKLNVTWNTDLKSDKNALVRIVQSNNALREILIDADVNNNISLSFEFISKILEVLKPHKEFNRQPPRMKKPFRSLYLIPYPSPELQLRTCDGTDDDDGSDDDDEDESDDALAEA